MDRNKQLVRIGETPEWDIVIIGGGATGLGAAIDAVSRGYQTLLIEQYDFSKGTSSKSTKLIHGGVRYLAQGNIKLVIEALKERTYLINNAPHLSKIQPFIIPVYSLWEKIFYTIGLKVYDLLSGKFSLGKTSMLSKKETLDALPVLIEKKVKGGVLYYDGQFDDSQLCIEMAETAVGLGACIINYCKATDFIKNTHTIVGVKVLDTLSNEKYDIKSKSVINATGVFTNAILKLDEQENTGLVVPSQGIHLVIDKEKYVSTFAMMIPKTADGRVLFAVPWHSKIILGTTDTPIKKIDIEPIPLKEEINFIINHYNTYSKIAISKEDVKSVYVGLRPLVKNKAGKIKSAQISRAHFIEVASSGLVTITGGKWTTYRKMAYDAVNNAVFVAKLKKNKCITENLPIGNPIKKAATILLIENENITYCNFIHKDYPYTISEIIYATRYQMAQTLEDILARRIRLLFLDASIALEVAPTVVKVMASELKKDTQWEEEQVEVFKQLVGQYRLN